MHGLLDINIYNTLQLHLMTQVIQPNRLKRKPCSEWGLPGIADGSSISLLSCQATMRSSRIVACERSANRRRNTAVHTGSSVNCEPNLPISPKLSVNHITSSTRTAYRHMIPGSLFFKPEPCLHS